jgi:hypothetical protein
MIKPGASLFGRVFLVSDPANDLGKRQAIGWLAGLRVSLQAFSGSADESERANPVAPLGVGYADAQLGQPLPQIAFGFGACLPSRLIDLVGGKWPALIQQLMGVTDRLVRRQGMI